MTFILQLRKKSRRVNCYIQGHSDIKQQDQNWNSGLFNYKYFMIYSIPQLPHKRQEDAVFTLFHPNDGNGFCTFFCSLFIWAHLPQPVLMNTRQDARTKGSICGHWMKTNDNNKNTLAGLVRNQTHQYFMLSNWVNELCVYT